MQDLMYCEISAERGFTARKPGFANFEDFAQMRLKNRQTTKVRK